VIGWNFCIQVKCLLGIHDHYDGPALILRSFLLMLDLSQNEPINPELEIKVEPDAVDTITSNDDSDLEIYPSTSAFLTGAVTLRKKSEKNGVMIEKNDIFE
jgi:hypothetical protein